jgi:hypothetical protein
MRTPVMGALFAAVQVEPATILGVAQINVADVWRAHWCAGPHLSHGADRNAVEY